MFIQNKVGWANLELKGQDSEREVSAQSSGKSIRENLNAVVIARDAGRV